MCAFGSEGFCEVAGWIDFRCYVLDLDSSSSDVVLYEVVFDVDEFPAFGRSIVLCYKYVCFVVY